MENNSTENKFNKTCISWYPGHMAKTKRLIKEDLKLIDIVYELVDARIPISSKIKDIDEIIKNKPKILIMTKSDLCDLKETELIKKYYESLNYKVILLDLKNNKNINIILEKTKEVLKELDEKRLKKDIIKKSYRALIIGIPNVGKSTLINRLVNKKAVNVGNKPGITKDLNWIRINKDLELLDTPGILWPKFDNDEIALNLASTTAIKEEILPIFDVSNHILKKLNDYYSNELFNRYGIREIDKENILNTYDIIAKKRGCLIKNNEIDYEKTANVIIKDIKDGNIKNITFDRLGE